MAVDQSTSLSPEALPHICGAAARSARAIQQLAAQALQAGENTEWYLDAIEALAGRIGILMEQLDNHAAHSDVGLSWALGFDLDSLLTEQHSITAPFNTSATSAAHQERPRTHSEQ